MIITGQKIAEKKARLTSVSDCISNHPEFWLKAPHASKTTKRRIAVFLFIEEIEEEEVMGLRRFAVISLIV